MTNPNPSPELRTDEARALADMPAIYVMLSDDNRFIRKWDRRPFDGCTAFYASGFPSSESQPLYAGLTARELAMGTYHPGDES